jgi:hypothetical protein
MEKIIWNDCLRYEEVLHSEGGEEYPTYKKTGRWIGEMLRRNCRLKSVIEGQIEGRIDVTGKTRKKT